MGFIEFEQSLLPLTEQEEGLKKFWEESADQQINLTTGMQFLESRNITCPFEYVLLKDNFASLLDNNTVSVIRQYRYLPLQMHKHDFVEILYIYQGNCTVVTEDRKIQLEEGDMLFNAPQSYDKHLSNNDDTLIFVLMLRPEALYSKYLHFFQEKNPISSFLFSILNNSNSKNKLIIKTNQNQKIRDLVLQMLYERKTMEGYYSQILSNQFELLLFQLLRDHLNDIICIEETKNQLTSEIKSVITNLYEESEEIKLTHIAEITGKSVQQLSHEIKTHFGKNFSSLCRDIRMDKATHLLKNPDMTMNNIVDIIGYTDISHFYKDFKKTFGTTPGRYRKQSAQYNHELIIN